MVTTRVTQTLVHIMTSSVCMLVAWRTLTLVSTLGVEALASSTGVHCQGCALVNINTDSLLLVKAIVTVTFVATFFVGTFTVNTGVTNQTLIKVETRFSIECESRLTEAFVSSITIDALSCSTWILLTLVHILTRVSIVTKAVARMTRARVSTSSVDTVSPTRTTNVLHRTLVNVKTTPVILRQSVARITATLHSSNLVDADLLTLPIVFQTFINIQTCLGVTE